MSEMLWTLLDIKMFKSITLSYDSRKHPRRDEGNFWGFRNILCLNLGGGNMGVFTL